jgi:SH3-like domain-containing protein
MPTPRIKSLLLVLTLLVAVACGEKSTDSIGIAYVGAPQVTLRDRVAYIYNKVGVVKNGDRVEMLDREKRFVKVRTASGQEGWMEQRFLVEEDIYNQFQTLAKANAKAPVATTATARNEANIHVNATRDGAVLFRLEENEKVDLIRRTSTEKPAGTQAPAKATEPGAPPPPKPMEDWWLVRNSKGQVGWVLNRLLDVDIPLEVAQYAEGQRIVAYKLLNEVEDDGKKWGQYLVLLNENRDGSEYDYNQVRVFSWNSARDRYETAYRERGLFGELPASVATETFDKEGTLPVFTLRLKGADGKFQERKYKLIGPIVRRIQQEGETPLLSTRESKSKS